VDGKRLRIGRRSLECSVLESLAAAAAGYLCYWYWLERCFITKKCTESYVYWTVHHCDSWRVKVQFDVTCYFFHFLCAQHISDINISIITSLRLFCWITTLVVLFLVRCVFEFRCSWFGVVSVLQAEAQILQMYRSLLVWSFIYLFIRPLIYSLYSVLWQVHCLFQSQFSTKYDVEFYLSIFNILSLPVGHSVAAYLFSLVFLSIPSFPLSVSQ